MVPLPCSQPDSRRKVAASHMHITAMGADADEKNGRRTPWMADRLIVDRTSQCQLGELRSAGSRSSPRRPAVELGDPVGKAEGRRSSAEITLCDLTETGVQDTAIAPSPTAGRSNAASGRPSRPRELALTPSPHCLRRPFLPLQIAGRVGP